MTPTVRRPPSDRDRFVRLLGEHVEREVGLEPEVVAAGEDVVRVVYSRPGPLDAAQIRREADRLGSFFLEVFFGLFEQSPTWRPAALAGHLRGRDLEIEAWWVVEREDARRQYDAGRDELRVSVTATAPDAVADRIGAVGSRVDVLDEGGPGAGVGPGDG